MLNFWKYQGAGNNFVILNNWEPVFKHENNVVQQLCNKNYGVGSDGLIVLEKSNQADFKMIFYNPDGTLDVCGNGCRCAVRAARDFNIITKDQCTFEAKDGVHIGQIVADNVLVSLVSCIIIANEPEFTVIDTGSQHYVKFVDDIEKVDCVKEGAPIRYDKRWESITGVNANFAQWDGKKLFVRTYEKGVEDETFACGTGSAACVVAAFLRKITNPPCTVQTKSGTLLHIDFKVNDQNKIVDLTLTGPAQYVFKGEWPYQ